MEMSGLRQSSLDPCLFVGPKIIAISYVNGLIFWAHNKNDIHNVATRLRDVGVDLKQETYAAGFLGIWMERDPITGQLEEKQEGLIL
jgi:hypothetical protein